VTLRWQPKEESRSDGAGAPERLESTDPDMAPTAGATILLAEDDPANSIMLTESLQSNGYRVVHVPDGVEAVARSRVLHPDLILMDIQMPNLDGLEATRLIRSDKSLKHIPIVAITALSMPGDRERCLEVGVNEYLAKPVGMRELLQTIRTQLRPAPARA
jgi:CheY-like chemotaxis protein